MAKIAVLFVLISIVSVQTALASPPKKLAGYAACDSSLAGVHSMNWSYNDDLNCHGFTAKRGEDNGSYIYCTDPLKISFVPFDQMTVEKVPGNDSLRTSYRFYFQEKKLTNARVTMMHFGKLEPITDFNFSSLSKESSGPFVKLVDVWDNHTEKTMGDRIRNLIRSKQSSFLSNRETSLKMMNIRKKLEDHPVLAGVDSASAEMVFPKELPKVEDQIDQLNICANVPDFKVDAEAAIKSFRTIAK